MEEKKTALIEPAGPDDWGIDMEDVSLDLPVHGAVTRSFRSALVHRLRPGRGNFYTGPQVVSVLKELNLSLRSGDRIGLMGHNGAGKSSLLRLLGGVYWPTAGHLQVRGRTRCLFGLNPGMEEEATGYENIEILSRLLGFPKKELDAIREDVSEFCELGDALERPVRTYSDGMRLRLCFGVITAWPADILLVDEVIGVGDNDFKEKAKQRMKDFIFRAGILILASHDTEILETFCTESIRLENGTIVERNRIESTDSEDETQEDEAQAD